jgi:hypothetical protein
MATFPCPSCARPLEADDTHRDWTVRCPLCATEFVPEVIAPAAFGPPVTEADLARDHDDARRRAFGPGMCLELSGWLFGFIAEVGALFRTLSGLIELDNPAMRNPADPPELKIATGILSGLVGVPYALVLVLGGRHLRELRSRGWATAGAITAVCSFVLFYVLCVCAAFPIGFGVWGLIALNHPAVRRAFEPDTRAELLQ